MSESNKGKSLQTSSFDDVLSACRDFAQSNNEAGAGGLAEYVNRFDSQTQPTLLRNLLHTDVARRRAAGENPLSAEYVEALPDHANLIRSAFLETVSAVFTKSQSTHEIEAGVRASKEELPVGDRLGNFRLVRPLGRGGMGLVFEAEHLQRKHRVALKTLPAVDGTTLLSFKQEFRRMAEVNHPHIVGLHALEEDHGHWFFTMDLIKGTDFLSYVRPKNELNISRLRATLPQLVSAILRLHGDNLIHRDLKPSNVMVDHDGKLIVLDFGLAYERKMVNGASIDGIRGTAAYMAPEQTFSGAVTGAADWYAVGVMLHEAISGTRPFDELEYFELITQKRTQDLDELRVENPALADLVDLTNGLLKRDPELRPDPPTIARSICQSVENVSVRKLDDSSTGLVGRDEQLTQLESIRKRCLSNQTPEIAFVSGRSGEGKTALVESFVQQTRASESDFVLLAGRCYDRESVPFKALDSLIDALANYLSRLPEADAALLMPDEIAFLAHLFPVLNRVSAVAKLSGERRNDLDQAQVRTRAFAGLRSLLKRICIKTPIILFADDLQWGDADSAQALFDVLLPPEAPNLLFIGSYRCEETDSSAFLVRWQELTSDDHVIASTDVRVSPLSIEDCVQLAVNTIGEDSERLRAVALELASQTGGNALLLTELLSCFDASSDSFKAIPIRDVIDTKLARLPTEAVAILDAISVSGRSIEFDELALAVGSPQDASSVITHMRSEKLVRLIGDESSSRVDTFHDKIRETVLLNMAPERRRENHAGLANAILDSLNPKLGSIGPMEKQQQNQELQDSALAERVFDLSYHFDGAGDSDNALKFSLLAAKQATKQFSQRVAADHFAVAQRNAPVDQRIQFEIAEGRGRALTLLGEYDHALQILNAALELSESNIEKAQVLGMQAEVYHKQGKIRDGIDHYAQALRKLGYFVPKSRLMVFAALAYESIVQVMHTYLPESFYRRSEPLTPTQQLAVELANRKSIVSYYSNVPRMVWTHIKGMNIAETRATSKELAYSYGLHPAPVAAIGLGNRGLRYSDRALNLAKEAGDLLTEGHCYTMRSMAYFATGMHPNAIAEAERAIRYLDKAGDPYLNFIACGHGSYSCTRNGRMSQAITLAYDAFSRSIRLGERASLAALLFALSIGTRGKFPFSEMRACYEVEEGDNMSFCFSKLAEGVWHFHAGRLTEAIEAYEKSWERTVGELIFIPYFIEGLAYLITTLRIHALALPDESNSEKIRLIKRGRRLLRRLRVLSRVASYVRPHYLREVGLYALIEGKPQKAAHNLKTSTNLAEEGGDLLEQALSMHELGKIESELGLDSGEQRIHQAKEILDNMQAEIDEQISISFG